MLQIKYFRKMEKDEKDDGKKPTTLIVMGMAGSGKTTFVQRLTASLNMANQERPPYVINLDPAVADLQFPVSYRFFYRQLET